MITPGPLELLIIGVIVLITVVALVVIILGLLLAAKIGPFRKHNSNLRPCGDCGARVSRRATSCPHCGCPVEPIE
jgi:hypothetical protein